MPLPVDLPGDCDGREYDLVVIGAGMEALHLVARLPDALLQVRSMTVMASGPNVNRSPS